MAKKRLNKAFYMNKLLMAIFFSVITLSCNLIFVQALTGPSHPGQDQQPLLKVTNSPQKDTSNVSFSELLGGNGVNEVSDVAFDASGNMFITGSTNSTNFPVKDAYQTSLKGSSDAFIAEFNPTGRLVMSTYFGGSGYDSASSITIDSAGNILITGFTNSKNFPIKNAYQPNSQDGQNVFVTKFNSLGQLLFSTYLGGSNLELSGSIAVDSIGNIFITGSTMSSDFPLVNPLNITLPTQSYYPIAFIAKFNSTGTLTFSTLLSGNDNKGSEMSWPGDIAVDSSDNYYVTGYTNSRSFPTKNAYQSNLTSTPDTFKYVDAFITKFNATNSIVFSTYLGGSKGALANSIAIDNSGNIYVTGGTDSNDFPIKNGYDTFNGSFDVFLSKFSSTGQLLYSTFLGGKGYDSPSQVTVDSSGNVFIIGTTNSTDFPTRNPYQSSFKGSEPYSWFSQNGGDMFLVEFDNSGALAYGTYFGGLKNDFGVSIAVDTHGDIYIAGNTDSTNMPLKGSYDKFSGSTDIYIAKFTAVPFSFTIKPHTIDFVSLTIISISIIIIVTVSLYVAVEYRQYRKMKREKNLHATNEVKNSFWTYLLNKIKRKPTKQVHYTLSDKSFEILEEILEETNSEN